MRPAFAAALCVLATACASQPREVAVPVPAPSPAPFVKDPRYWPEPVMDSVPPELPAFARPHAVLVFSKTNGFRDDAQSKAADAALKTLVERRGWDVFVSENAAVFNTAQLAKFDVIVLNSISGNVFTDDQRAAFRQWIEGGGGVVALHGSGGDHHYDWPWYVQDMLGAQFIGHTYRPQFQQGTIRIAARNHPAMRGLPQQWRREEEWYSFDRVPKSYRTRVLAWLDETSYAPEPKQRMGKHHPIVWTRCIGTGRLFFSALGHKAETYSEPLHLRLIDNALGWAVAARTSRCR